MTPSTDAPNANSPDAVANDADDSPYAADNDAAYTKLIQFSLRNQILQNLPQHPKKRT